MRLFLFVLTALALVACHPHSAPKPGRDVVDSVRVTSSPAMDDLRAHPLTCGQGKCPAGVGVMTAVNESGTTSCTGFMANARTFVTNRHCLPESLARVGATCRGRVAVAVHDGTATQLIECDRVLDVGAGAGPFAPDFAYLSLTSAATGRLVVNREGVADDQTLLAWTVSRIGNQNVIRALECRSTLNTLLNPFATTALAPVSLVTGCELVAGNSGAPLVNARDEVVGIAQMRATRGYRNLLAASVTRMGFSLPEKIPPHVNFTNLACANDPNTGAGPQSGCASHERADVGACGVDQARVGHELERKLTEMTRRLPRVFRYAISYDEARGSVAAEPLCVVKNTQDVDAWVGGTKVAFTFHVFPYHAIALTLNGITQLQTRVDVDEALRFTLRFTEAEVTPHAIELEHFPIGGNWLGTITRERKNADPQSLPLTIPECSAEQFEAGNRYVYRLRTGGTVPPEVWREHLIKASARAFCPR